MATEVKLPNLGENIESGDVLSILVSEGDVVQADDGLLELETDKATVEVPAPAAGTVSKIHISEGDTIQVGSVVMTLEESAAGSAEASPAQAEAPPEEPAEQARQQPEAEPAAEQPASAARQREAAPQQTPAPPQEPAAEPVQQAVATATAPASAPSPAPRTDPMDLPAQDIPGDGHSSAAASPSIRRLARELGVDLRRVRATGAGGRITKEDVQSFVRQANQRSTTSQSMRAVDPPGSPSMDDYGAVRREKMSRMRQTIAKNMLHSYTTVPQLTNFDDADITELEKIRQESKEDYARSGVKLTTMPFLIKAVAFALKQNPVINASVDMENNQIIYKEYVNIGIAVDTDRGLLVPVMRDVDQLSIPQIARELASMAEKARSGDFSLEDLRGGTFTISNLGAIGGTYSTPIINPPEVSILLTGRSRKMPQYIGEELLPRLMMPLSITYDHRVVDGAAASRFLNEVKNYLSAPGRLLLAP